jgi:hypothetical protein
MKKRLQKIVDYPHILGHYLGYTDLTEIHSDWIRYMWRDAVDRTIMAHRGSYKTTAVVVVGAIWRTLFKPDERILICREEYGNACATLGEITKHYQSAKMSALYEMVYGEPLTITQCKADSITLGVKQSVTKEGNIEAIGLGGSSTGRHYDRIITDDIVTMNDRYSKAKREETKRYVQELQNIVNPSGAICHSCTTWHPEDATATMPEIKRYPVGTITIKGLTTEKLEQKRKSMTPSMYAANYELRHIADTDRLFPDPVFVPWDGRETIAYLDPAYSGKDTTAITIAGYNGKDILVKGYAWRRSVTELYATIAKHCIDNRCGKLVVERNADKGMSEAEMRKHFMYVTGCDEREPKVAKIDQYAKSNYGIIKFCEGIDKDYMQQINDYAHGIEPDDAPDSLAGAIRELLYRNREVRYIG